MRRGKVEHFLETFHTQQRSHMSSSFLMFSFGQKIKFCLNYKTLETFHTLHLHVQCSSCTTINDGPSLFQKTLSSPKSSSFWVRFILFNTIRCWLRLPTVISQHNAAMLPFPSMYDSHCLQGGDAVHGGREVTNMHLI